MTVGSRRGAVGLRSPLVGRRPPDTANRWPQRERRHGREPAAFRALNPAGQVPVLLDGGRPIADSTAILRRVLTAAPGRIAESPEGWLYEELADTAVNGFLVAARWADDRNWPATREACFGQVPAPIRRPLAGWLRRRVIGALVARDVWRAGPVACWDRLERLLDSLEGRAPARGFWLGDAPSVADIGLAAQLRSLCTPLTAPQAASVRSRTALSGWLDRVDAAARAAAERGRAVARSREPSARVHLCSNVNRVTARRGLPGSRLLLGRFEPHRGRRSPGPASRASAVEGR